MREKILTKKIAACLLGILLCAAIAFCALAVPARADEVLEEPVPADGRINEDFEDITSIHRYGSWTLPSADEHTFFLHSAYVQAADTKIADDPTAAEGDENKNHVLQLGKAMENVDSADLFGTRSFTNFNTAFTVSFDFYFSLHMKNNNFFAPMFFGAGAANDFGTSTTCMPYKLQTQNSKELRLTHSSADYKAASGAASKAGTAPFAFDAIQMPLNQWFTVTVSIDAENGTGDLYWSTVNPETNEREYHSVVHGQELNDTWKEGAKKGLGYVRFGSQKMDFSAGKFQVPYYIDNMYVQPTNEPLSAADAFRRTHTTVLNKDESVLVIGDDKKIDAALAAYDELSEEDKTAVASEYEKLTGLQESYASIFGEDKIFKAEHAAILAKTVDTLVRSDYAALTAAVEAFAALEQKYKDLLATESETLDALSNAYAEKYPIALSEDFQSFETGERLPYADGATLDVNAAIKVAHKYQTTYSGIGVAQDPLDADNVNKVYKLVGPSSSESVDASMAGEIMSRMNVWRYNDKFTVKTSYYIPEVLRAGESLAMTFNSYNRDGSDAIDNIKAAYRIESEFVQVPADEEGGEPTTVGRNVIRRGDYGSLGKDIFVIELPLDRWFDIIVEVDKTYERLSIYLEDGEKVTLVCNSPCGDSQIGSGLAYFSVVPVFAALADENETPSVIYVDNLYLAPQPYLSDEKLAEEIAAAKEEAQGYLQAIQKYLTPEQPDSGDETGGEQGGNEGGENTGENGGEINTREAATDYDALIAGFDAAKSRVQLVKLLADFKLRVNNDLLIPALDEYVTKVKTDDAYSEAGIAAIDAIVTAAKNTESATSLVCKRHGVSMQYTYYLDEGVAAVKAMYEALIAAIDDVPTAAEEVTNAKEAAVAELDAYSIDDYREAEKEAFSAAVNDGKEAVNAAESVEAVESALAAAKAAIALIKTDAQYAAEEAAAALAVQKTAAKSELDDYKNADDYREAQKAELARAIEDGKAAIDSATTQEEVAAALANAKTVMDGVKTDAQLAEEEAVAAAALAEAKTAAKSELAAYKNAADYRNAQKTELAAEISAGNADIDKATTEKAVATALALAKAKIDLIKTDAQLTAEGVPNEDGKQNEQPPAEQEKGGESGCGCGSDIFADSYALIAFVLLAACAVAITFAPKKKN